jgi:hypothetical protein
MSIKVINEVKTYDIPNTNTNTPSLKVCSDWTDNRRVVLTFNEKSITVYTDDLRKAIQNASNT